MIVDRRIPAPVEPIIKNYLLLIEQRLVGMRNAFYVVGSIALGELNERFSDIDFLTILNGRATSASEKTRLRPE